MDQETMKHHGAFSWNELMTTDVASAKAFYSQLFGWDMHDEPMPQGSYTLLNAGDRQVGGIMAIPAEAAGAPPAWGAYVTVDNVDEQATRAETLGGRIVVAPQDIPNVGRFAVISDPQGAMLSMITYTSQG